MSQYPFYEEEFDDYVAVIGGDKRSMRLTIFYKLPDWKKSVIAYQADCDGVLCLKKLKNQISEFRYGFTQVGYDYLGKNTKK